MPRRFNVAGPCKPELHYMLPAAARVRPARRLVADFNYFVIHAPRQTGKTTSMIALAQELTASGAYVAALVSVEVGAAFNSDPGAAELAILGEWRRALSVRLPDDLQPPPWPAADPGARIGAALQSWAKAAPRPLVVFVDEIDALQNETLISVLRQLRAGHPYRPKGFPWSLGLVGPRDVRDYKVAAGGSEELNPTLFFDIHVRCFTLRAFTEEEVTLLYVQRTAQTGQRFEPEACARAFALTRGQPWLVNALAYIATEELKPDPTATITVHDIERARGMLVEREGVLR